MRVIEWLVPAIVLAASSVALAAEAPRVSTRLASNANDLQRAVWACESGASAFAPTTAGRQRFFLGTVDASAGLRNKPPLRLQNTRLVGLGSVSNDRGWFNIGFSCTLSGDLRQASAFTFHAISPIPASAAPPRPSGVARAENGARMNWYSENPGAIVLKHGIKETDDQDFTASCGRGSGKIAVSLTRTVEWLAKDDYVTIGITSGAGSGLYVARAVASDESGTFVPEFTIGAKDPLLGWMTKSNSLLVNIGSESVYEVSLERAPSAVKAFTTACR